jgi:hypothetical protein
MYGLEGIMKYWFWMEVDGFWWIDLSVCCREEMEGWMEL